MQDEKQTGFQACVVMLIKATFGKAGEHVNSMQGFEQRADQGNIPQGREPRKKHGALQTACISMPMLIRATPVWGPAAPRHWGRSISRSPA